VIGGDVKEEMNGGRRETLWKKKRNEGRRICKMIIRIVKAMKRILLRL
jgi:hypothetical protein